MIERLGQLIYWIAFAVAVAIFLVGVANLFAGGADGASDFARAIMVAILIYLAGRAVLYASTGR